MVVFVLNGFVFITIGLQLPEILGELRGESLIALIDDALLVSGAAVLIRIGWVFVATYLPRSLSKRLRERDPYPDWRNVISLAAAFALPFVLPNDNPFPGRNYILFFTFCVILVTLVFQGLTLPILIRKLRIKDDGSADEEERKARVEANKAALSLVESLANNSDFSADAVSRLRAEYDDRLEQLELCAQSDENCGGGVATP
jgi:monovalent cation/hydrogen antiporter